MRESPASISPVPTEQQPLNEYEQLNNSWFFSWVTLKTLPYVRKLIWVWLWGWLVSGPIAAASFPIGKYPLMFILTATGGSLIFVIFTLLQLYLGWSYVSNRLAKEIIFYEESGWYDGQHWQKPPEVLNRDRLVVSYQVKPILQRLKISFATVMGLFSASGLMWLIISQ